MASRFRELREEDIVGGFVLRRFEHFISAEVRTWWIDGVCRLVGPVGASYSATGVDLA